jgi:hypothetical protein
VGKPFDQYTYQDALELFGRNLPTINPDSTGVGQRRPNSAKSATKFLQGDHWQESSGFIGQLPPTNFPDAATILTHIKQRFDSENVIKEVVETHRDGVLGREPLWSFLPSEGKPKAKASPSTQSTFEESTGETLTQWWNDREALDNLQRTLDTCLCEERAAIRIFFPRGRLPQPDPNTNNPRPLSATNLVTALDYIYFETHTADVAGVFVDDATQHKIGVFLYDEKDDEDNVIDQCAELSYLDQQGLTVCRVVKNGGGDQVYGPYELGGRLLIHELKRSQLITEQVQSNQKGLNFAKTMMLRNVNMAGARERTVSNTQPPGKPVRVQDPENPSKTILRHDGKYQVGAGAVMFLMGYPIYNDDGHVVGYTNPTVDRADPSPVNIFIETADDERTAILRQCHQLNTLIAGDATASGLSRKQAEKGWQRSLKESKTVLDAAGRWQLETTLRLAAQISNQASRYRDLRADFNCLLDVGEPDPQDVATWISTRAPGGPNNEPLLSDETIRQKIGVEDPAAEQKRIKDEAPAKPVTPPAPANELDQNANSGEAVAA